MIVVLKGFRKICVVTYAENAMTNEKEPEYEYCHKCDAMNHVGDLDRNGLCEHCAHDTWEPEEETK